MSEYETIVIEKRGQVDWLTLNRPEALNAITTPMVTELRDYFGGLAEDKDTRIVVMRGAGR
ncbi:MAG: enoyl-CoA hydratase/isomerase family protein, partial [Gammaproteobacteria bacterium]|nr:enoyl-CoA hydratase/isomerase family protein [Gammaproteobacteria bacterium]